jgi:hypothetical protein
VQDVPADKEITMEFVSIRIITDDVARLAGFYERATGVQATWSNENFAELTTGSATLAIASTRTVPLFAPGAARPADNSTVIIEFLVDAVPRSRRQPRQLLHPRHPGRHRQVRPLTTPRGPALSWILCPAASRPVGNWSRDG